MQPSMWVIWTNVTRKPCVDQPWIYRIMSCIDAVFLRRTTSRFSSGPLMSTLTSCTWLFLTGLPPLFCKRSNTGGGKGLGTRLTLTAFPKKKNGFTIPTCQPADCSFTREMASLEELENLIREKIITERTIGVGTILWKWWMRVHIFVQFTYWWDWGTCPLHRLLSCQ